MSPKVADGSGPMREYRGPVKDRSCTDVFCLIIFIAFLVGWGIVGYFGFTLGDPQRIIHPTDSYGRMCGMHDAVKDKPYLFFFDLAKCANPKVISHGCPTPQECVKECPNENFLAVAEAEKIGQAKTKAKMICKENATLASFTVQQLVDQGLCASYYMQSKPVARRCIPNVTLTNDTSTEVDMARSASRLSSVLNFKDVDFKDVFNGTVIIGQVARFSQVFGKVYEDLQRVWWIILISFVLAALISFIWILLMRWVAGVMVWISILAIMALQSVGIWYCYERYMELKSQGGNLTLADVAFTTNVETYMGISQTWLVFIVLLGISLALVLLAIIFLRNRIRIAIALIGQGSRAVGHMMSTLTFPLFPFLFQVAVLGYFLALSVYIFSIGQSTYKVVGRDNMPTNCSCPLVIDKEGTCSPIAFTEICASQCDGATCQYVQFGGNRNYFYVLEGYNLFGLFWGMFFITAFSEMVLAGAFAAWYWTFRKPQDLPSYALTTSFSRTIRYHLGTVALGSLIISIIRSIRVLLEYVDRKIKQYQDNCCSKCLLWTCKCCFWLLEKFMRFVNRNAYIMTAISGKSFCASAQEAFMLLLRNVVRVVVLDKVTDFLLFLGRLVVVGLIGAASYYAFTRQIEPFNPHIPTLNYYLVPMISTIIGAYFISGIFFGVYAMAIDTLFLCFLHDSEINDGSPERPYYMPVGLMEIVGKKNKQ